MNDGVYFHLPEEDYHADPALGSTDIKNLRSGAHEYWHNSVHRPRTPEELAKEAEEASLAKVKGNAIHSAVLLGEEHFRRNYCKALEPGDLGETVLRTQEDLRAFLRGHGAKLGGSKAEQIQRVVEIGGHPPIWDLELADFAARCKSHGLTPLPPDVWAEVQQSAAFITRNPVLSKAFTGGAPEVSVFWHEEVEDPESGQFYTVPLKARFDYLKPRAIVDLKSINDVRPGRTPVEACLQAIWNFRYDGQATHYGEARKQLGRFLTHSHEHVFGATKEDGELLHKVVDNDAFSFVFVFYRPLYSGAPWAQGIQYEYGNIAHGIGLQNRGDALLLYAQWADKVGLETPWVWQGDIHTIVAEEVPLWLK